MKEFNWFLGNGKFRGVYLFILEEENEKFILIKNKCDEVRVGLGGRVFKF